MQSPSPVHRKEMPQEHGLKTEGVEHIGHLDDEKVSVFLIIVRLTTHLSLGVAKGDSDVT